MPTQYVITIGAQLDARWADWFDGLTLSNEPNGTAVLAGLLVDQAALFGVLMLIRDLGVPLIAVEARAALDQPAIVTFDTCAQAG